MKKRHLKKWVENTLVVVTILLVFLTLAIDDIDLRYIPLHIVTGLLAAGTIKILNKYGTGAW